MFGTSTSELIALGVLAAIVFRGRLLTMASSLTKSLQSFRESLEEQRRRREQKQPPRIDFVELVTEQREPTMTERFKKYLWSPAFWATLGVVGLTAGLYFQRVAANGSGLWCLGLIFLGAAYIEHND